MAARLTVVISQSTIRDARAADTEGTLLAELMMVPGLDATLVGSLEEMQVESTDYLCLSSFSHNVALVTWLTCLQAAEQWRRLELGGQVVQAGDVPVGKTRIVHYLSLKAGTSAILSRLKQLLADKSVQTVSLLLPMSKASQAQPSISSGAKTDAAYAKPEPSIQPTPVDSTQVPENQWTDLDRLVDDFESLDL